MSLLLAIVLAVGPEIAVAPVRPFAGYPATDQSRAIYLVQPAMPAAGDGAGFAIAWTSISETALRPRTLVARLDSLGQPVFGTARELPVTQPYYDAVIPSVAVAPNGYFVAQTESAPLSQRVVVWHLDPTLKPDPQPFAVIGTERITGAMPAGLVRVDRGRVFVVTSSTINEYALDGTLVHATPAHFPADDAVVAAGTLITAGDDSQPVRQFCGFGFCSSPSPEYFDLLVSYDEFFPAPLRMPFYSADRAGIATDGTTVLYVFSSSYGLMRFLRYDVAGRGPIDPAPRILGAYTSLDRPAKPAAAFDGTRYVVIWQTAVNGHAALAAAAVERDGTVAAIAIPSSGDETLPAVTVAGANRFLITYQSPRGIAGRFITFGSRRPAAGR